MLQTTTRLRVSVSSAKSSWSCITAVWKWCEEVLQISPMPSKPEDGVRRSSEMHSKKTKDTSGHKVMDMMEIVLAMGEARCGKRLPSEVMAPLSLTIFKTCLDNILLNLNWLRSQPCFEQGIGSHDLQQSLPTWMILWFQVCSAPFVSPSCYRKKWVRCAGLGHHSTSTDTFEDLSIRVTNEECKEHPELIPAN